MYRLPQHISLFEYIHREAAWQIFAVMLVHQLFFVVDLWLSGNSPPDFAVTARRRLVGVMVLGAYLAMWYLWIPSEYAYNLYAGAPGLPPPNQASAWLLSKMIPITLLVVSLQAILEKPIAEADRHRGQLKIELMKGWPFKLLHPGWASGVVFAFLLAATLTGLLVWRDYGTWEVYQLKNQGPVALEFTHLLNLERSSPAHWAAMSSCLICPLVLWMAFFRKQFRWNLVVYVMLFLGMLLLHAVLLLVILWNGNQTLAKWTLPFPAMYWLWPEFRRARALSRFGEIIVSRVEWSNLQIMIMTGAVWLFWWMTALGFALRSIYVSACREPLSRKARQ